MLKRLLVWAALAISPCAAFAQLPPPPVGADMASSAINAILPTARDNLGAAPGGGVNVTDYGADPTGVADSATAIQNAFNAAGGRPIFFPVGQYKMCSAITSSLPVNVSGVGTGSGPGPGAQSNANVSQILLCGATQNGFVITSLYPSYFHDFQINVAVGGRPQTAGYGIELIGGGGSNAANSVIERVGFTNVFNPIHMIRPWYPRIQDNYFDNWGAGGAVSLVTTTGIEGAGGFIGHNVFFGNGALAGTQGPGVYSEVGYTDIHDNQFLGGTYSVDFSAAVHPAGWFKVHDNSVENSYYAGVRVQSGDGALAAMVQIENNEFSNVAYTAAATSAIQVNEYGSTPYLDGVQITGNKFRSSMPAAAPYIWVQTGNNIQITDNNIADLGSNNPVAIAVAGVTSNAGLAVPILVSDNTIRGTTKAYSADMLWSLIETGRSAAPNILVNGSFQLDQPHEGASFSSPTGGNTFAMDGWTVSSQTSATGGTTQQVTDAPAGAQHSMKYTVGTGGSAPTAAQFTKFWQRVEANSINNWGFSTASAKAITASAWLKSSVAGTYALNIQNTGRTRSYYQPCVLAAATWTKCVVVMPGDTTAGWTLTGTGVGAYFQAMMECGSDLQGTANTWLGADTECSSAQTALTTTTGATFQIANAKLEVSPVPTPLAPLSPQADLSFARRYYAKTFPIGTAPAQNAGLAGALCTVGVNTTAGTIGVGWRFPTEMRTSPTITTYNPSAANANWRDVTDASDATVSVDVAVAKGTTGVPIDEITTAPTVASKYCIHAIADARL